MSAMIVIILVWCLYTDTRALILAPRPWTPMVWVFLFINILLLAALFFTSKKAIQEYQERRKDEQAAKEMFEMQTRAKTLAKYREEDPEDIPSPSAPEISDDDKSSKYLS